MGKWADPPYGQDGVFHNPSCFGFYLQRLFQSESSYYVLTSLSCLLDTKKIAEMLDNNESHQEVMERILSRQDLKSEINQYVVVDPHFKYKLPKWKMGENPKWNFKEDVNGMYFSPIKNIFVNPDLGREGLHSMKRATLNSPYDKIFKILIINQFFF